MDAGPGCQEQWVRAALIRVLVIFGVSFSQSWGLRVRLCLQQFGRQPFGAGFLWSLARTSEIL